ncbi:MAG: transposase [Eggerthellaceae bacterium]|nr:transposase [Eggerthellaceae bacterium]
MSRPARSISQTGFYHIIFRGVNHCHLFEEKADYERFCGLLVELKHQLGFKIHAYSLMANHCHLLIEESRKANIAQIMMRLLGPYASWFNRQYGRSGALIANRYKSECVEDDSYLLALVRYIHKNPLEAGIVERVDRYRWSSYRDYVNKGQGFTETDFVLSIFSPDPSKALDEFKAFHGESKNSGYTFFEGEKKNEEDIRREILAVLGGMEPHTVCGLPRLERDAVLASLRKRGLTVRQIERATGVSKSVVAKVRI